MIGFHEALIEKISDALGKVFNENYPDPLLQTPYVGPEYPLTREVMPSIVVLYQSTKLQDIGLGNLTTITDPTTYGISTVHHWRFEGNLQFEMTAYSTIDRTKISDQVTQLLAYGYDSPIFKPFWDEAMDDDYIAITLLNGTINAGFSSETPAPWDTDQLLYKMTSSVGVTGEFYSDPVSGGLVQISAVNVYPYRSDQNPPQGTGTNPWLS